MTVPRTITSLQHPLVKHLVKLRQDSKYRYESQSLLLEGTKPIQEVANSVKKLIYTEAYAPFIALKAPEEWMVTEAIMEKISGLSSPEGMLAEVQMPPFSSLVQSKMILALDGINDPGNLGTLMRTALAFGWDGLFLLPTSCDPYNEKVLRSARGAHFKLSMRKGTAQELKELAQAENMAAFVADLKGFEPEKIPSANKKILVLGNEAHGASQEIKEFCSSVTLPMVGEMESLNVAVAGGILLYLLKK